VARAIADSQLWVPDHLAMVLGLILVLGGLVAIARSIHGGLPGAWPGWARSPPWPASLWASSWSPRRPGRQAARRGLGNRATAGTSGRAAAGPGRGDHQRRLGALFNILFAGVTFILYGLAVAWSQLYPRWLGWVVVRAGLGLVAADLIQPSAGEATTVTRTLTIIFPTVITPWLTQMGMLAFRRAPQQKAPSLGA